MPPTNDPLANWPLSIANWMAFDKGEPPRLIQEFPLFTDAWITGEAKLGPYLFMNTIAFQSGRARPAIVLRYAIHREWPYPNFEKTNADLYHAGSAQEELSALASLAMGIRLRAGDSTRTFEPNGDPLGRPMELRSFVAPQFHTPSVYRLPTAAKGRHELNDLDLLNLLPQVSQSEASAIVRAARLYQDALWLVESEPELTWLLLVSALETAANEWQSKESDNITRLQESKPKLYDYLSSLKDSSILQAVADFVADGTGVTRKFVAFAMEFIPGPPEVRPPPQWAQFKWEQQELKQGLRTIYDFRSRALHDGRPFPLPMCEASYLDSSWLVPAETMFATGTAARGGVWRKEVIPMTLHVFEHIARNVLLRWWAACVRRPIK